MKRRTVLGMGMAVMVAPLPVFAARSTESFDVIVVGGGHAGRARGDRDASLRTAPSARGRSRGRGDPASARRASLVTDGAGRSDP